MKHPRTWLVGLGVTSMVLAVTTVRGGDWNDWKKKWSGIQRQVRQTADRARQDMSRRVQHQVSQVQREVSRKAGEVSRKTRQIAAERQREAVRQLEQARESASRRIQQSRADAARRLEESTRELERSAARHWRDNQEAWQDSWEDTKESTRRLWVNRIDPNETYTEEIAAAVRDPETARRIADAALSGDGQALRTEGFRYLPVYDPYTRKVRTLDAAAREYVGRHSDHLAGSAFEKDPVAACALAVMATDSFLLEGRILRTPEGEWLSVREAISRGSQQAAASAMEAVHARARAALAQGRSGESARLFRQFADIAGRANRESLSLTSGESAGLSRAQVLQRLISAPVTTAHQGDARAAEALLTRLEVAPVDLLRQARAGLQEGKVGTALRQLDRIVQKYPHSGFADDAAIEISQYHYRNLNYEPAIAALETFLQRYPASDKTDLALFTLAQAYEATVIPPEDARMAAVRNYRQILDEYESGAADYTAEVVHLVLNRTKALDTWRLLAETFPDSEYAGPAQEQIGRLVRLTEGEAPSPTASP